MIANKGRPVLILMRMSPRISKHIFSYGTWRYANTQLERQLIGNTLLAPERITHSYFADQLSECCRLTRRLITPQLSEVIQELGDSLDTDAEGVLRLIHKGTKVFKITGKQMGCLTRQCCLKNRLIFFCKAFEEAKVNPMLNKVDAIVKQAKTFQGMRKLSLQVAACFLQRICVREQFPVALDPEFNDKSGFSCRVM